MPVRDTRVSLWFTKGQGATKVLEAQGNGEGLNRLEDWLERVPRWGYRDKDAAVTEGAAVVSGPSAGRGCRWGLLERASAQSADSCAGAAASGVASVGGAGGSGGWKASVRRPKPATRSSFQVHHVRQQRAALLAAGPGRLSAGPGHAGLWWIAARGRAPTRPPRR
jgi:hypothetical protein